MIDYVILFKCYPLVYNTRDTSAGVLQYKTCFLDRKYETVILPIFGTPAPFHIATIKVGKTFIILQYFVFDFS